MRLLRRLALVLVLVGNAHALRAQMETLDLSDSRIATVVPAEYDGGFFARIGDIVVNELGIWVTEVGHMRVLWFDESGSLMAEFGREGSGPGEFLSPSIVSIDSVLTVDDFRQGRLVRFRLDGTHIETKRVLHFANPDGFGGCIEGCRYPGGRSHRRDDTRKLFHLILAKRCKRLAKQGRYAEPRR